MKLYKIWSTFPELLLCSSLASFGNSVSDWEMDFRGRVCRVYFLSLQKVTMPLIVLINLWDIIRRKSGIYGLGEASKGIYHGCFQRKPIVSEGMRAQREKREKEAKFYILEHLLYIFWNALLTVTLTFTYLICREMFHVLHCHYLPIKGHHTTCDSHVHGYLSWHSANQDHLFTSVWMKGWIIDILCSPQFIFSQSRCYNTLSWNKLKPTKQDNSKKHSCYKHKILQLPVKKLSIRGS